MNNSLDNTFYLDSCTTHHVCNNSELFSNLDKSKIEEFTTVGGKTVSSGTGSIYIEIYNIKTNHQEILKLDDVAFLPKSPKNLLSVGILKKDGLYFENKNNTLFNEDKTLIIKFDGANSDNTLFSITPQIMFPSKRGRNGFKFVAYAKARQENVQKSQLQTSNSHKSKIDRTDWMLIKPEFDSLNEQFGPFDTELFKSHGNAHLPNKAAINGTTAAQPILEAMRDGDAFSYDWHGKKAYGNLVFDNDFITKTFEKAEKDYHKDKKNSAFLFIVPHWETSQWWSQYAINYKIVRYWPANSMIFTVPCRSHFKPENTKMSDDGRVFIEGTPWPVVALYKDFTIPQAITPTLLAHLRFGHYGVNKLKSIWTNGIKTGLSFQQHAIDCDSCKITKARRPHAESTNREGSKEPGQLIFSDVLVINIGSKEGYLYIVHFTDDYSRFTKPYFLKKRSDIYDAFKDYITWFEKEYNKTDPVRREIKEIVYSVKIKDLQSDQAGEYTGTEMEAICNMYRIKQRFSSAYLHENAAIAERIWETLQDMVRAMMYTAEFPKYLWPLAFRHAAYLYVRLPHSKFNNECTPYEKFYNTKPDLSTLRVFGCIAYAYTDKSLRQSEGQKLDDRAKRYKYVGNDEISTSYLLLDENTEKVHRSGMTTFVEETAKYGKIISSEEMPSNYNFSLPDKLPMPYTNKYDDKNDPAKKILEIAIYLA
jgi:transposase InsO family protein